VAAVAAVMQAPLLLPLLLCQQRHRWALLLMVLQQVTQMAVSWILLMVTMWREECYSMRPTGHRRRRRRSRHPHLVAAI
jgi:hypothetical protein